MRNGRIRSFLCGRDATPGLLEMSRGLLNRGQRFGRPGRRRGALLAPLLIGFVLLVSAPSVAQVVGLFEGDPFGVPQVSSGLVIWSAVPDRRAILTAVGPDGLSVRKEFAEGAEPWLELADLGNHVKDGEVNYSLWTVGNFDLGALRAEVEAGERSESALEVAKRESEEASKAQTGGWLIAGGAFVSSSESYGGAPATEASSEPDGSELQTKTQPLVLTGEDLRIESTNVDLILVDTGANPPNAGSWAINVDEAGPNDFAIQSDENGVTGGAQAIYPFVIHNSTSSFADDALVINSVGNVGLGTNAPLTKLHIVGGIPALRLENTNATSSWDFSPGFSNLAFRNSSNRVFSLRNGAPQDSLFIDITGNVGLGTAVPSASLEIEGSSGTSQILVDEQGADAAVEVMFNLVCDCAPGFRMQNTVNGEIWFFRHTSGGDFSFDNVGSAGLEARLDSNGNFFIQGSLSQGSSRALKEDLELADGDRVLDALDKLDLYEWSYLDEASRHFGPMAEEFSAAYGLGESRAKIAPSDMAGVALAGVKALHGESEVLFEETSELRRENFRLREQVELLLGRVSQLEKALE